MKTNLLIATLASLLMLVACGKKSTEDNLVAARGSGARSTNQIQPLVDNNQFQWIQVGGTYGNYQYDQGFQQAVAGFVSSFMNPSELGRVSSFMIKAMIRVDAVGNVDGSRSQLAIQIMDSYAGSTDQNGNLIPEIPIMGFARAAEVRGGQGQGTEIVFKDSFGEVIISLSGGGGYNTYVTGQIRFNNYRMYDGSSQPLSGVIGQFQAYSNQIVIQ